LWDEITIPIKHGSDDKLARAFLERLANEIVGKYSLQAAESWKHIVEKYLIEDARVEPTVTLIADENWMTFTIRYVVDFKMRRSTKDRLFTAILEEIEKTKGKVAIASTAADISLVYTPPLNVNLKDKKSR